MSEISHILATFPVLKNAETKHHGSYVTEGAVLKACSYYLKEKLVPSQSPLADEFEMEPFERVGKNCIPFRDNVVPIYSLEAAATRYSHSQAIEELDEMVRVRSRRRVTPGMFVAKVKGCSMEPSIPDGSWCLFQYPPAGSRTGRVLLVQHRDISDPETGGSYTVKRWQSDKVDDGEGGWRHTEIRLMPDNPDKVTFKPIVLKPEDEGEVMVVADFVEVLT